MENLKDQLKLARPFLIKNRDRVLYRSTRYLEDTDWAVKKSPTNRTPRDTPQYLHEIFDEYLEQRVGHRYRSAAIFCADDISIAENYANNHNDLGNDTSDTVHNVYIVIPQGRYELCYDPSVEDLYDWVDSNFSMVSAIIAFSAKVDDRTQAMKTLTDWTQKHADKYGLNLDTYSPLLERDVIKYASKLLDMVVSSDNPARREFLSMFLGVFDYRTSDIVPATKTEIMVKCDSYLLIDVDFYESTEIQQLIDQVIKDE